MYIFRADNADAATRVVQRLASTGLDPQLERYGPKVYVVVNSTRPDVAALALSVSRTVRRVPDLEELHASLRLAVPAGGALAAVARESDDDIGPA